MHSQERTYASHSPPNNPTHKQTNPKPKHKTQNTNNREALAQKLEYHLSNGVMIYLAFHTGPGAPRAFVPSDAEQRGRDDGGPLIGACMPCACMWLTAPSIPYRPVHQQLM